MIVAFKIESAVLGEGERTIRVDDDIDIDRGKMKTFCILFFWFGTIILVLGTIFSKNDSWNCSMTVGLAMMLTSILMIVAITLRFIEKCRENDH